MLFRGGQENIKWVGGGEGGFLYLKPMANADSNPSNFFLVFYGRLPACHRLSWMGLAPIIPGLWAQPIPINEENGKNSHNRAVMGDFLFSPHSYCIDLFSLATGYKAFIPS